MHYLAVASTKLHDQQVGFAFFAIVGAVLILVALKRKNILAAVAVVAVLFWLGRGIGHGYDCPNTSTGKCASGQTKEP